ncbi:uncharacterized protein LOC144132877 [Amblyomma americanum]
MMKIPVTAAVLLLATGSALAIPKTIGPEDGCNFSGLDLDNMVNAIVSQLPPEYSQPDKKPEEIIPGVFLGTIVYTGLDRMRQYGPALGYCRNGSRLVQVDLDTGDDVVVAFTPWKTCAGQEGRLSSHATARVTVTFKVVDASADSNDIGFKLIHHSGPSPVSIEGVSMYLDGAGELLGNAVTMLCDLFPQRPREFWRNMFTWRLRTILREISGLPS